MIAWIKANKGAAIAIGGAIAAAAGGLITWSDAAGRILAALGLGVQ
jgi:drug/metabolite transporter superfamily protein YnfA